MKYILGFFHSIYLSYKCRFGGEVRDKTLYLLWPIKLHKDVTVHLDGLDLQPLHDHGYCFYGVLGFDEETKDRLKWVFRDDSETL